MNYEETFMAPLNPTGSYSFRYLLQQNVTVALLKKTVTQLAKFFISFLLARPFFEKYLVKK